jgi:hypothetical protein
MFLIDGIALDEDIIEAHFSCDLEKCKGACCTFVGDFGAPVLDEEVGLIEDAMNKITPYLSERSLSIIKSNGFVEGYSGTYTTTCINRKDCVFVYYDEKIAKCAIEKAYFEGKIEFRKPVSCHLFPIRIRDFGGPYLCYENIPECNPAVKKGEIEKVKMYKFLKDALSRSLGEDWYNLLIKEINSNGK